MPEYQTKRKLVIVDLDGTLIRGNSFSMFTLWLVRRLISRFNLIQGFAVTGWVLLRKIHAISHSAVKKRIMKIAEETLSKDELKLFSKKLLKSLNPESVDLFSCRRRSGDYLCLATAAPYSYASILGNELGFDQVEGTRLPGIAFKSGDASVFTECKGEAKLSRVRKLCEDLNIEPSLFLTDHIDDLPLMKWVVDNGGEVGLISPDKGTIMKIGEIFSSSGSESGSKIKILVR